LLFSFFFCTLASGALSFNQVKFFKVWEKKENSLEITKYVPILNPADRIFERQYWKVYYQHDKIVGEELYVDNQLVYYYIYYYEQNKIYQKGFFWHGIYRDIKYFKAHGKYLKQGWIYKNYPETYKVFNLEGNLIYSHHYKDFES